MLQVKALTFVAHQQMTNTVSWKSLSSAKRGGQVRSFTEVGERCLLSTSAMSLSAAAFAQPLSLSAAFESSFTTTTLLRTTPHRAESPVGVRAGASVSHPQQRHSQRTCLEGAAGSNPPPAPAAAAGPAPSSTSCWCCHHSATWQHVDSQEGAPSLLRAANNNANHERMVVVRGGAAAFSAVAPPGEAAPPRLLRRPEAS